MHVIPGFVRTIYFYGAIKLFRLASVFSVDFAEWISRVSGLRQALEAWDVVLGPEVTKVLIVIS
jgi:hypothetical protein